MALFNILGLIVFYYENHYLVTIKEYCFLENMSCNMYAKMIKFKNRNHKIGGYYHWKNKQSMLY